MTINQENLEKVFDFLHQVNTFKSTLRFSSLKNGPRDTPASHSWRLAVMAMIVAGEFRLKLNLDHAIKMALVHDIAESITGDIDAIRIAKKEISREEKRRLEANALKKLMAMLPKSINEELYSLWKEYEDCTTEEARFIKALDKLETLTHLVEMGHKYYDEPDFIIQYPNEAVKKFPALEPMLKRMKEKLRVEFKKGNIPWKAEYNRID